MDFLKISGNDYDDTCYDILPERTYASDDQSDFQRGKQQRRTAQMIHIGTSLDKGLFSSVF